MIASLFFFFILQSRKGFEDWMQDLKQRKRVNYSTTHSLTSKVYPIILSVGIATDIIFPCR